MRGCLHHPIYHQLGRVRTNVARIHGVVKLPERSPEWLTINLECVGKVLLLVLDLDTTLVAASTQVYSKCKGVVAAAITVADLDYSRPVPPAGIFDGSIYDDSHAGRRGASRFRIGLSQYAKVAATACLIPDGR